MEKKNNRAQTNMLRAIYVIKNYTILFKFFDVSSDSSSVYVWVCYVLVPLNLLRLLFSFPHCKHRIFLLHFTSFDFIPPFVFSFNILWSSIHKYFNAFLTFILLRGANKKCFKKTASKRLKLKTNKSDAIMWMCTTWKMKQFIKQGTL